MSRQQMGTDTLDAQQLLSVLTAINAGDFSQRLSAGQEGTAGEIAGTLNALFDRLEACAFQVNRITTEVTAGKFGGQAQVAGLSATWKAWPTDQDIERFLAGARDGSPSGTWKELIDNLNVMSARLTHQVRDIATVVSEVTHGNPCRRATVGAQGEMQQLKEMVNTLVDQSYARQSQHTPRR